MKMNLYVLILLNVLINQKREIFYKHEFINNFFFVIKKWNSTYNPKHRTTLFNNMWTVVLITCEIYCNLKG